MNTLKSISLVEVAIVTLIISILLAIAIPNYMSVKDIHAVKITSAKQAAHVHHLRRILHDQQLADHDFDAANREDEIDAAEQAAAARLH